MTWQKILRQNITSWEKLCEWIQLDLPELQSLRFPLNIPLRLIEKIEKGNLHDPILKQFVPCLEENQKSPLFSSDPVGDQSSRCCPKGLKKYAGRLLLITTQACAMHCRYCFRQQFPYNKHKGYEHELKHIQEDPSIQEVILSGGDPLSLGDRTLKELLESIQSIPHVKRLRFHTRFPIGIPERITTELLEIFSSSSLQIWFVIHCNHPRELDPEVLTSLKSIQKIGIPVLNQSVLLKGVNDSVETLKALCEILVNHGIQPYYLHQLDRVEGAVHFEVSEEKGIRLVQALRKQLSGYAIPTYVQEIANEPSKTLIL